MQTALNDGVRSLPASFLIGPDGKVLAKNLIGENLKQTVAQAIKNLKESSGTAIPARMSD